MVGFLKRLLFGKPKPARRLTVKQVIELGNEAAQKAGLEEYLGMALEFTDDQNRPAWVVCTAGVGYGWQIVVDDETGIAGPLLERPGRTGPTRS